MSRKFPSHPSHTRYTRQCEGTHGDMVAVRKVWARNDALNGFVAPAMHGIFLGATPARCKNGGLKRPAGLTGRKVPCTGVISGDRLSEWLSASRLGRRV